MSVLIDNPTEFIHASQTIVIQSQPKVGNSFSNPFRNIRQESYAGDSFFLERRKQRRIFNLSFERLTDEDYSAFQNFYQAILKGQIEKFNLKCVPISAEPFQSGLAIDGVPVTTNTLIFGTQIDTLKTYNVWDRYEYTDVFIEPNSYQMSSSNRGNLHNISLTIVKEQ